MSQRVNKKKINNAIQALENKKKRYEYQSFKYKGEKLSFADADSVIYRLEVYKSQGDFDGLIVPGESIQNVINQIV